MTSISRPRPPGSRTSTSTTESWPASLTTARARTATADDLDLAGIALAVRERTAGRGADYPFESTGVPGFAASPLRMIRHGMAVQVSRAEQSISIDMSLFEFDKTYVSPLYGQCSPTRDFPRLLNLYERGDVLLDAMVAETYPLDDVARAFDDMLAGTGAKRVLVLE